MGTANLIPKVDLVISRKDDSIKYHIIQSLTSKKNVFTILMKISNSQEITDYLVQQLVIFSTEELKMSQLDGNGLENRKQHIVLGKLPQEVFNQFLRCLEVDTLNQIHD